MRDFSFGRLPEDELLLMIPFVMAGMGECDVSSLHPEDEEVFVRRGRS